MSHPIMKPKNSERTRHRIPVPGALAGSLTLAVAVLLLFLLAG